MFWLLVAWPKDVRPFVDGRQQHRKSLQTSSYREACSVLRTALAAFEDTCNKIRIENGQAAREARERAQYLALAYRGSGGGLPPASKHAVDEALLSIGRLERALRHTLEFSVVAWNPDIVPGSEDYDLDGDGPESFGPEEVHLPAHWNGAIAELIKRLIEDDALSVQPTAPSAASAENEHSLTATLEDMCARRQKPMRKRSEGEYKLVVQRFDEISGGKPVERIAKADGAAFLAALGPTKWNLSPPSQQKHISFIKRLMAHAENSLWIEHNPLAKLKSDRGRASTGEGRAMFSQNDLKKLFGGLSKDGKGREAQRWWALRLARYTGARVGELAQLTATDVFPSGDAWFLHMNTEGGKTLKTATSKRCVPLHRQLIMDGFLEFVKKIAPTGGLLFPQLQAAPGRAAGAVISQWFTNYRRDCGINDSRKVFHSFRHSFEGIAKAQADVIKPELRDAIIGHANPLTSNLYGYQIGLREAAPFNALLKQTIELMDFDMECMMEMPSAA